MNLLPTALTELPFSRQKQNLINQFINPFYADYKQSQQVSLNEKDLEKLFKQQLRMSDYLEGTPKAQLRQLFQTKRQQDKIQDVLKKASIRTLRHLKKGVELFDKILLDRLIKQLHDVYADENKKTWKKLGFISEEYWDTHSRLYEQNQKLDFYIEKMTENFKNPNERQTEKMELKKVIYKIHLMITKLFRPNFLAREWLSHHFKGNDVQKNPEISNYNYFPDAVSKTSGKIDYILFVELYISNLIDFIFPIKNTRWSDLFGADPNELTFERYLERMVKGISSGNSNKVFSSLMKIIKDKHNELIIELDYKISRNQTQDNIAVGVSHDPSDNVHYVQKTLKKEQYLNRRQDDALSKVTAQQVTAVGSDNEAEEYNLRPFSVIDIYNRRQPQNQRPQNRVQQQQDLQMEGNEFQEIVSTDSLIPLAREIEQNGLFNIPPLP